MDTNDLAKVISGGSNKDDPCDEPAEVGVSFASQMIQRDVRKNERTVENNKSYVFAFSSCKSYNGIIRC